ncbi:hypothetical protein Aperf_G00000096383 [Anoplocephala perfoliata]
MQPPPKISFDGLPFCDYIPRSITSLARNKNGLIVASRLDGSIDIYDENDSFYLIHHIPSWSLTSIESVCWASERLFATGGEGRIFELQLFSIHPKASVLLPGGVPARCLTSDSDILVSGNDGGYVNIIDITDGRLELKSCLASLDDKIVALALDASNRKIVAVSDAKGKVCIFRLEPESLLSTYAVGDEYATKPTIVWSLLFVGNSLFSGDSRGHVSIWDVEVGSLVSTFKTHAVDVLALTVSTNQKTVFAAGVDPLIRRFDLCRTERSSHWQPSGDLKAGHRDIRCLIFVGEGESTGLRSFNTDSDYLVAAGNDSRLRLLPCPQANLGDKTRLSRHQLINNDPSTKLPTPIRLPFWPLSLTPYLPLAIYFAHSSFETTNGLAARLCLVRHVDHLCLYRLPPKVNKKLKDTARKVLKLAHIQPLRGNYIVAGCISPCGKFLAYSDDVRSRVLKIKHPTSQKSWHFKPDSGPLITLSRLGWPNSATERRARSASSSASSDNDNAEEEEGSSRFLFLDQSSADLFVTNGVENTAGGVSGLDKNFDSHLARAVPRKRKASAADDQQGDQSEEASALPPAALMAFTPSSVSLVTVDQSTQNIVCRQLDTGVETWTLSSPSFSDDNALSGPIHLLKMVKFGGVHSFLVLMAIASLDARVYLYVFTEGDANPPVNIFTCPRAADPVRINHHPRPVDIALRAGKFKLREEERRENEDQKNLEQDQIQELQSIARVAVLYTSGQLIEWIVPLTLVEERVSLSGTPKVDAWLEQFWKTHNAAWRRHMPRFNSLDYFYGGKIFMLGSRNICLTIDRRKDLSPRDVQLALRERNRHLKTRCLQVFSDLENALHYTVLPDRIAALTLDIHAAMMELPEPLKKKRFGT